MRRFHFSIPVLATCVLLALFIHWLQGPDKPSSSPDPLLAKTAATPNKVARATKMETALKPPADPVSGRQEKPLAGTVDLKLPRRGDLRWLEPVQETVFEEFRHWTVSAASAVPQELLEQGLELALKRRGEMADLIEKNPQRALELAVPESVRRHLPADVAALLEQRVSGRGDLMVQATTHTTDCAHGEGCQISRTVALADGREFDAHTFGRRSAMPMRDNIAIHGVALDGKLALSDLPGRVLDPAEVAAIRAQGSVVEEPCLRDAGEPHETSRKSEVFIAWDDSRTSCYCSEAHARLALDREEGVEQSGSPAEDESDPDGEIAFSPMTEGQKKLLFIRVDFPDFPGQVVGDSTLGQLITDMDTVYSDMSYGKATFAALGQGSAITPTVRLPNDSSYYTNLGRVLSAARTAAAAAGYNYQDYNYEVVVTGAKPYRPGTAGVAWVGSRGAWLHNSQWNIRTCAHEVGHNFGLPHSGAWDTDDDSVIGPGEVWDYGNVFDIMGVGPSSTFKRHFSASAKVYLDWLPMSDVVKITTSANTTSRIRAMDKMQADGNNRALAVDRWGTSDDYWVEYRQTYGTSYGMRDGVLVNWANINGGYEQPLLLDMKPDTFEKDDAVLPMGKTFSDMDAGIHITPVARGTDPDGVAWMDVTVRRGTFGENLKPSVSLSASTTNPAVDASVSFTATASDPNGDTLGYFWEWGDGTTTANNSATASKSWSTSGVKTVRCIVTDMKGLTATAQLLVQVGTSNTFFIQGVVKTFQDIPLEGVVVRATSSKSDTTDSEGFYAITGLAAGSYTLTATKSGATIQTDGFTNPVSVGPSLQNMNFSAPPGVPYFNGAMKPGRTDQGSSTGAIPIPLTDPDTDVSLLSLGGTSSNTAIIPNGNITFGFVGASTHTVSVSAGSNVSGTVDITITATDPGGNSSSYIWPVTVNAKPVLSVSGPTVAENVPLDIDLRSFVTDDITPDELMVYLPDRVRNGTVAMLPDGYTARFTPPPDFNGNASFRLVTRDQSLGPNFRFLYDFEPPDTDSDARSTDQSNYNRSGNLQSVGGGVYAYSDSVPPLLAPQSAQALTLNQSDSSSGARLIRSLSVEDHDLNDADWTFSAWVNRASDDTEDYVFYLGDGDGYGSQNELALYFSANSGILRLRKWGAGGLEKEIVGPDLPTGEWHHITLVYDRTATATGTFYLYVGPFLSGSVASVNMDVSQSSPLVVGGHASTSSSVDRWFDGIIDEALFQRAIPTRTEIHNLSRMGARHYHGLSASATVNITVTGANQPPAIAPVPDWAIPKDVTSVIPLALSDAETEHRDLTLTASSSNAALLPNSNISVISPQAWTGSDIGAVGAAGSFTEDHGTFLIGGAGADIGPAAGDAFRWVRQNFTGNAEMIARVVSMDHTTSDSKAGIMMRQSATATSPFAYVCVTPSDGVSFLYRSTTSTTATVKATLPQVAAPCWVKLVRAGTSYTAYYAPDNAGIAGSWQAVGTPQTLSFAGTTHDIGMAVTSNVNSSVCTAVFDSLGGTVQRGGERILSLTPVAGQSGSSIVTLTTSDGSSTDSLTFNVIVDGTLPSTTVWSATTSGTLNWSTGTRWTGGVPPPSSRFSTIEFFTGQTLAAGTINSNNDTAGGHFMNVLTLGGAGPASGSTILNLSGAPLVFRRQYAFDPVVNLAATNGTGLTWNVSAPVTMEDSTTFQGAGTATFLFNGDLGGGGSLFKTGSSKLTLTGANTYAGTTTISGGILQVGNDGASGALPSGEVINNAALRFDRTGTLLVPNDISGTGDITVDCPIGAGTIVLSGNNSFTGIVTVASGALRITNSSALGTAFSTKNILLTNGTAGNPQLRLDGSSGPIELPNTINLRTSNPNGAIFNEAGDNIIRGKITLTTGGGDSRVVVNTGSLRLTGAILSGTTSQRTLILAGEGMGQAEGAISDGPMAGGIVLVRKLEAGNWTLTGANTYTGTTTLNAGTLRINAPGSLHASSAVTVNSAVLGGDGSIGGLVTVAAGGSLSPGVSDGSAGTLAIGGDLNLSAMSSGTGKLLFELGAPAASDTITVGGSLTIGGDVLGFDDFVFSGLGGLTAGTYKLIASAGITGTLDPAKLSGPVGAFIGTLQINGNDLEIVVTQPGFASWQTLNGATGTMASDHDGDNVPDGIEYFLGGPDGNTTGFTVLPGITNNSGTLSVTWTMGSGYNGTYGTGFVVETSASLTGAWTTESPGGNVIITGSTVKYTFPSSPGTKGFARLKVMNP